MQALRSVPEQGQLAVVRQRRYVVTDVRTGVSGTQIAEQPQHLVSLTSIEDDALGEELQVIWEIEPGARAFEKMELPEPKGFDQPAHLEAFLDAVRWPRPKASTSPPTWKPSLTRSAGRAQRLRPARPPGSLP